MLRLTFRFLSAAALAAAFALPGAGLSSETGNRISGPSLYEAELLLINDPVYTTGSKESGRCQNWTYRVQIEVDPDLESGKVTMRVTEITQLMKNRSWEAPPWADLIPRERSWKKPVQDGEMVLSVGVNAEDFVFSQASSFRYEFQGETWYMTPKLVIDQRATTQANILLVLDNQHEDDPRRGWRCSLRGVTYIRPQLSEDRRQPTQEPRRNPFGGGTNAEWRSTPTGWNAARTS